MEITCDLEKIMLKKLQSNGIFTFAFPVACTRQIALKNLGINTAMTDKYTLKFISKS